MDLTTVIAAVVPPQYAGPISIALGGLGAVMSLASLFIAKTDTPDPTTKWGKVYAVIEKLAGVFGKAKQTGPAAGK